MTTLCTTLTCSLIGMSGLLVWVGATMPMA